MSGIQQLLVGAVPAGAAADADFKNTVLLLPGDGTNGAQNNTFLDSSTNAFSITRNGNTTQGTFSPFSQTGWSNYFDGSGDWLTVADNAALDLGSGALTIEFWVNPSRLGQAQTIVSNWQGVSNGYGVGITSGNVIRVNLSGDGIDITGSVTLSVGQWYHVAVSGASNSYKLFVNGTQDGSTYTGTPSADGSTLFIGADPYLGGSEELQGYISNLRIVKGTSVYSSNFTPPTAALTAITNTSLLTCQSNRFVDNSTNAFTITRVGNTSVQAFSPFAPTAAYSAATNGGSGYFDGTGDYLSTSTSQIIPTGSFTIEAWVYTTQAVSTIKHIVAQGTSGDSGRTAMGIESSLWWFQIGGDYVNAGTPVLGQWNYVAMTFNGSTIQGYVNGVSQGSIAHTGNSQNTTLTVGTNWNSNAWNGYIASVRISNTVRTVTTVPTAPFTNDANTRFLVNFTNAGIYDAASKNDLETVGNAQISNGAAKFGSTSMYFDGTGDALKIPSSPNFAFGTGNFTVEFWMYATDTNFGILYEGRSSGSPNNPTIQWSPTSYTSKIVARMNDTAAIQSGTLSTNTWYHVALVRSGTTATLYIDGTSAGTYTYSTSVTQVPIFIGDYFDGGYDFSGYIDDLRITKGIARYTANFTAPTKAFALQ